MINLFTKEATNFKNKIEYLLGEKVDLTNDEINKLAHLTFGNLLILKVLEKLNLNIDDIIYEKDRELLKKENEKEMELLNTEDLYQMSEIKERIDHLIQLGFDCTLTQTAMDSGESLENINKAYRDDSSIIKGQCNDAILWCA
jgi:hypothetical protein